MGECRAGTSGHVEIRPLPIPHGASFSRDHRVSAVTCRQGSQDHTRRESTRPQVCGAADNPRFYALLAAYGQATGLAALLNTSFNLSGMPIVSTPVEAMLMLARTDIDTLVLDDTVIRKPG